MNTYAKSLDCVRYAKFDNWLEKHVIDAIKEINIG